MMKKILFLMLTLLTTVGAWAQSASEVKTSADAWVARIKVLPEGALTGNKKIDEERDAFLTAVAALDKEASQANADAVNAYLTCTEVTPLNGYYRLVCFKDNKQLSYYYFAGGKVSDTDVPAGHYLNVAANPKSAVSVVNLEQNAGQGTYTMYVEGQPIKQVTGQYQKFELDATATPTPAQFQIAPVTDEKSTYWLTFTLRDVSASTSANTFLHGNMESIDENRGFVFSSEASADTRASYWYLVPAKTIEVELNQLKCIYDVTNDEVTVWQPKTYATRYFPFPVSIDKSTPANLFIIEQFDAQWQTMLEFVSKFEIPSNTGMLVRGDKMDVTTITLNILDKDPDASYTGMTGTNLKITSGLGDGKKFGFNIRKDEKTSTDAMELYVPGFYPYSSDATVDANRAYVQLSTVHAAQSFSINFDGEAPTVISQVVSADDNVLNPNAPVYDLSGRRVVKATKGFYIQGGKKFYVK